MMAHVGAESSNTAFAGDLEDTGSFLTSQNPAEKTKSPGLIMASDYDAPSHLADEFGQDSLLGMSDFETFFDIMEKPNGLSTANSMTDMSSSYIAAPNMGNPVIHIEESPVMKTDPNVESATLGSHTEWQQNPSDSLRPAGDLQNLADRAAKVSLEVSHSSMASSRSTEMSEDSSSLSSVSSQAGLSDIEFSKSNKLQDHKAGRRMKYDVRPRASIPQELPAADYARQCISAAESSRLNPYALHVEEHKLLRSHITPHQVTTYLNIRNGILRLWVRNPLIGVLRNEAIGCAREARWFDVANICYEWLVRNGYINYGCLETMSSGPSKRNHKLEQKTVAVIGAGMSGLGCARQLEGLFAHYKDRFRAQGQDVPKVVVVEGRDRVGGRVYSRGFQSNTSRSTLQRGNRCTAEMGGMIITGFDRGNPLNILVRGQLALDYHGLRPTTTIYDSTGQPVEQRRDQLAERLYNDILDRVSDYKFKTTPPATAEGDHEMVDACRDSHSEYGKTIAEVEERALLRSQRASADTNGAETPFISKPVEVVPVSSDRLTGRAHMQPGTPAVHKAAYKARLMGWSLKEGIEDDRDLELDSAVATNGATLGSVMDAAIHQYRDVVHILPLDLRLLNWHIANLEYSNAINYKQLSLAGWDVDAGNEWEGKHTQIIGGYQQVPRGLLHCPYPLDVQKNKVVKSISSYDQSPGKVQIRFDDSSSLAADVVVNTMPLGVLKSDTVEFSPSLPSWKTGAIGRLGFGILNKVVLVYKDPFWDTTRDIFGVLREPLERASLNQEHYSTNRGRFFQWFNATKTSGLPTLIALMAGDAAYQTEQESNESLVAEATTVLRRVFGETVPVPVEAIVTRWGSDPFARGSYSCTGPDFRADDYETMAKPVGKMFFAGEHTCGTHPATVHGAYISGLRAAAEVLESMIGPIDVPSPLILPKDSQAAIKRKAHDSISETMDLTQARLQAYEVEVWTAIYAKFGEYPMPPPKPTINPYILFNKARFEDARHKCEEGRRPGKGRPVPNEVRVMLAKMWKDSSEEDKLPFKEQALEAKRVYGVELAAYIEKCKIWDTESLAWRKEYEKEHPSIPTQAELDAQREASPGRRGRKVKRVSGYAEPEDDASDIEM